MEIQPEIRKQPRSQMMLCTSDNNQSKRMSNEMLSINKEISMTTNQPVDLALVGAYLHNLQLALIDQPQHAELLLAHALQLMAPALTSQPPALHHPEALW
jgi:hypothetical protein